MNSLSPPSNLRQGSYRQAGHHIRFLSGLRMLVRFLACPILVGTIQGADLSKLTNLEGRVIEVEVIALNDNKAELLLGKKPISYPMDQLSEESQAEVKRAIAARKANAAVENAARMKLPDGKPIVPNSLLSFTVKATDQERKWTKNEHLKEILISVSFPKDFDPGKPCPVFFVDDTTPGANAKQVGSYRAVGNEMGYVVIGAQAEGVSAANQLNSWDVRGVATMRAVTELGKNWPAITQSDWYFGGCSGGAKNCCYLAVYLHVTFKKPVSGFFISAANEMKLLDAIKNYKSDKQGFRKTVFFVSSGKTDTIATPEQAKNVADGFARIRLGEVRFELHDGGHILSQEHYRAALKWFTQLRKNP
jgi:predicted esterase